MDALQAMVAHLEQHTVRGIERRLQHIGAILQLPDSEPGEEEGGAQGPGAQQQERPGAGAAVAPERLQYLEHSLALVKHTVSELVEQARRGGGAPGQGAEGEAEAEALAEEHGSIPAYRGEGQQAVEEGGLPVRAASLQGGRPEQLVAQLAKLQQQLAGAEGKAAGQEAAVGQMAVLAAHLAQRVEALEGSGGGGGEGGVFPLNPLFFAPDSRPSSRADMAGGLREGGRGGCCTRGPRCTRRSPVRTTAGRCRGDPLDQP
jgi:hypothetical protein